MIGWKFQQYSALCKATFLKTYIITVLVIIVMATLYAGDCISNLCCAFLQFSRGIKMEQVIREEVVTVLRRRCGYSFPPEFLHIGKLSCRSTFQQIDLVWVTYRSVVVAPPSLSFTSSELVEHFQDWAASNTTVCVGPFTLNVNPSCRVGVASLKEPECSSFAQTNNN